MIARIRLVGVLAAIILARTTLVAEGKHWDPSTAVADARHDIAQHRIRFCFIGGYVPHPVGVPDDSFRAIARYPHLAVGNQGCIATKHSDTEHEYAKLYNQEMWRYVSEKRH